MIQQENSKAELIELKQAPAVQVKAPQANSIPGIIRALNDEYISVKLHNFSVAKELGKGQTELTDSLYQHDAAVRLIAK